MRVYSLADNAEECSRAALFRRDYSLKLCSFCGLSAIISVICERIGRSRETGLIKLWLTWRLVFHCMLGKIRVLLHKIQRRSTEHSSKLDDFALVCRIFASSFENQMTGLNERRNIIGAHI